MTQQFAQRWLGSIPKAIKDETQCLLARKTASGVRVGRSDRQTNQSQCASTAQLLLPLGGMGFRTSYPQVCNDRWDYPWPVKDFDKSNSVLLTVTAISPIIRTERWGVVGYVHGLYLHIFGQMLVSFGVLLGDLISLCGLSVVHGSLTNPLMWDTCGGYRFFPHLAPVSSFRKCTQTSKHKPTCGHAWMHVTFWDVRKVCFCGQTISFF